jgi:hypothetical protein
MRVRIFSFSDTFFQSVASNEKLPRRTFESTSASVLSKRAGMVKPSSPVTPLALRAEEAREVAGI